MKKANLVLFWKDKNTNPTQHDFWFDEKNFLFGGVGIVSSNAENENDVEHTKNAFLRFHFGKYLTFNSGLRKKVLEKWAKILKNKSNKNIKVLEKYFEQIEDNVAFDQVVQTAIKDSLSVIELNKLFVVNHAVSGNIFETHDDDEARQYVINEKINEFADQISVINECISACDFGYEKIKSYTHELPQEFYGRDNKLTIHFSNDEEQLREATKLASEILNRSYTIVTHYRPSDAIKAENSINALQRVFLNYKD